MTADKSKESPKGSDKSLERQKHGRLEGTDKGEAPAKPDIAAAEQAEASAILSEAANKNPQEKELTPIKPLIAMQGIMDPAENTTPTGEGKVLDTNAPNTETKPIKTPDDMYERMFASTKGEGDKTQWQAEEKTQFNIGAQFWQELPAEKQVALAKDTITPSRTETKDAAEAVVAEDKQPEKKATTVISDMSVAHVPVDTKNKVVLQISASETVYKSPPKKQYRKEQHLKDQKPQERKEETKAPTIAKEASSRKTYEVALENLKPVEAKHETTSVNDAPVPIAKTNDVPLVADLDSSVNASMGFGRAVDTEGKTIGHWFNDGHKLVMSISLSANVQDNSAKDNNVKDKKTVDSTDRTKPAQKTPQIAAGTAYGTTTSGTATRDTVNRPQTAGEDSAVVRKDDFAPPDTRTIAAELENVAASNVPVNDVVVPQAQAKTEPQTETRSIPIAAARVEPPVEKSAQQKEVVAPAPTGSPHAEVARAVENIGKSVASVQEHASGNHPLGAVLEQKASAVQRDVQDVFASHGAKQASAIASLDNSVKDYNKFLELNNATAAIADKLKISSADVDSLKTVFQSGRLEGTRESAEQSKFETRVEGLFALRDHAQAHLKQTIDLIDQFKDTNLTGRLFQTAMILGLATNKDLSSPLYADIFVGTLNRAISDSSSIISYVQPADISARIDFAPGSDTMSVSQENRSVATPVSVSQTNAQATVDGQSVRLDNAVNPVFSAVAMNAGTKESYEELARAVEERVEFQRLYQELPDWMKEKGFRIALSPGTPPSGESNKAIVALVPRIRGSAVGDARIVAPSFKPLPTLGDRQTLTGMQGISRILGGFDVVSLVQYNHLMQLLQTAEDKALVKATPQGGGSMQLDRLLRSYPFLAQDTQGRQSALFMRPDSKVDFGPALSPGASPAASAVAAVASSLGQEPLAGQSTPPAKQDEET